LKTGYRFGKRIEKRFEKRFGKRFRKKKALKKDMRLRMYGTAEDREILVEKIDFTYASEPSVMYRQAFILPVAYEVIGEKHLVNVPNNVFVLEDLHGMPVFFFVVCS
jgi:hypothetical protein